MHGFKRKLNYSVGGEGSFFKEKSQQSKEMVRNKSVENLDFKEILEKELSGN